MVAEEVPCTDGHTAVVWWPRSQISKKRTRSDVLWVLLPSGMKDAASFYTEEVLCANLFESDSWCSHNPGIANECVGRPIIALTEVGYLEHFLTSFLPRHYQGISVFDCLASAREVC